jgi:hypothetical protein
MRKLMILTAMLFVSLAFTACEKEEVKVETLSDFVVGTWLIEEAQTTFIITESTISVSTDVVSMDFQYVVDNEASTLNLWIEGFPGDQVSFDVTWNPDNRSTMTWKTGEDIITFTRL